MAIYPDKNGFYSFAISNEKNLVFKFKNVHDDGFSNLVNYVQVQLVKTFNLAKKSKNTSRLQSEWKTLITHFLMEEQPPLGNGLDNYVLKKDANIQRAIRMVIEINNLVIALNNFISTGNKFAVEDYKIIRSAYLKEE